MIVKDFVEGGGLQTMIDSDELTAVSDPEIRLVAEYSLEMYHQSCLARV